MDATRILKRIFGIPVTRPPADHGSWAVDGSRITVSLARMPELKKPGDAVRLEGQGLDIRVLLFIGDDGAFHAFENRCACAGWRIDPVPGTSTVQCCTLGRSTYDYEGKAVSGPAKQSAKDPLRSLPVSVQGDRVVITLG